MSFQFLAILTELSVWRALCLLLFNIVAGKPIFSCACSTVVSGETRQVSHRLEAGANVPRSLTDGRMDVEGARGAAAGVDRLLPPLLQVGLADPYRATFHRSRRPLSLPDDANIDYLYLYTVVVRLLAAAGPVCG